ncbi:hypothetical protein BG011_003561 [Mortierella polycephala]|uniref:TRP C-terminal domain-containing protein n=1 Tax=Mortierella polycephala TaxID=41804 RepID=A0A9P6Q4Q5_9FUNG|nr:hypothetical protein BG011_003561 [Mortierella polycephala]
MLPRPTFSRFRLLSYTLIALILTAALLPWPTYAGVTSARLQCQYSFLGIANLIHDGACTLQPVSIIDPDAARPPPTIPVTPLLSTGPLTNPPTATNPWSYTPGWTYNPIFSCCSYSPTSNETDPSAPPTLITSADLSAYAASIDNGQQQLEVSVSYYTSDAAPSSSTSLPASPSNADIFRVLIRFLDGNGEYMRLDNGSGRGPKSNGGSETDISGTSKELYPWEAENLLFYAFDAVTLEPVRVPPGARGAVVQILVPVLARTSYCFDYFALRLLEGAYHPRTESVLEKVLLALGALVLINAAIIPIILFYGLPGWLWRSAPVNFFQKNPVVDHFVPLALFISTCQWIYNILLQYLGGSSSTASIIHSQYALWLIPLVLIGTFFVSAFAHWALFLCYNQVMHQPRSRRFLAKPRRWRAPVLGLWASTCLIGARCGVVALAVVQGGYWSVPVGILLAVPETVAMISVAVFFIKTMWKLASRNKNAAKKSQGVSSGGIAGGHEEQTESKGADLSRTSSTTPLWDTSASTTAVITSDVQDDFVDLSSYHHRAYVKSLLTSEVVLKEAAGSMYGRSTVGSDKTSLQYRKQMGFKTGSEDQGTSRYMGSTLNTTISTASSSATGYARHPSEYDFNISPQQQRQLERQQGEGSLLSPTSAGGYDLGRSNFPFERSVYLQQQGRKSVAPTDKSSASGPPLSPSASAAGAGQKKRSSRPSSGHDSGGLGIGLASGGKGANAHKLTWNSATTSYTTTSAALPMTGAPPTPSAWEYIVFPKRLIWPTIKGTYLLIVRLPLRILVAVLTTLVLCYDVLLSIGAAETVLAVPVSCFLGAKAYPGSAQFDNTMNVARAMHTVNFVLVVVLLPAVVMLTVLHQIRMIQKYNWCLRLLRTGNYGFVPGGREYTQHLKHPVRFIGYTVGFGVVGLCFSIFLLFTLCTVVAMLLVAATFRSSLFRTLGSRALAALGICLLLILILWLVQMLVIRYRFRMPGSRFFLSPQQSARTTFHHWEFFWAFFNIVFGALAFCKRILLSVLSIGIYSTRMDLCIMGGRFRPWDGGYSAFVGLVLADHVLNHPIVLEFVQILRDLLLRRRHPHLAHLFLEARERRQRDSHRHEGGKTNKEKMRDEEEEERERRLMLLMMNPQHPYQYRGAGPSRRPLNDIEEGEEARMDDLLMASENGGGIGGGLMPKSGAVVPEVSKIHHYFRMDQRVERHKAGQGRGDGGEGTPNMASSSAAGAAVSPSILAQSDNNRMSKVYTPLLATTAGAEDTQGAPFRHVHLQDSHHDPTSIVSQEQIRQKLTEAKRRSIRVRNRWFLYVTLARNPSLRRLRRTRAVDYLHPIAHGSEYGYGLSHKEENLADIRWDRED